jgi:hypothetical protein
MEHYMVFDDKEKKRLGWIFSLPPVAFFICFIYYMFAIRPVLAGPVEPGAIMEYTLRNYTAMFVLLAIAAVIAAAILIYAIVIMARLKNMNAATKLLWLIVLCTFAPVATFFFWFFVINREPKYVPIHPDIA